MRKLVTVSIATLALFGGLATATTAGADELPGGTVVVLEGVASTTAATTPNTVDLVSATSPALVALSDVAGGLFSLPTLI